jgi:hypothetical protein
MIRFCKDHNYPWALQTVIDVVMQNSFPIATADFGEGGPQIDKGFKVMDNTGRTERSQPPLGGTSTEPSFSFFRDLPDGQHNVPDVITFIDSGLTAFDQGVDSEEVILPAGYISLRVTGRTQALLGMQRFDRTGFVEIAMIRAPDGARLIRQVEDIARFQGGNLHWGQANGRMDFLQLEATFGNNRINTWKDTQAALGGSTFTNNFMRRLHLAAN